MIVTKEVFDQIDAGEIFKTVTTRIQGVHEPLETILTFVCVKGQDGFDWAIYAGIPQRPIEYIRRYGDKVHLESNIRSLCPCDDAVYALYRH